MKYNKIEIHYAVQVCDVSSYQGKKRFCGNDRTLLSKKSIKSLFNSIKRCYELQPKTKHHVMIVEDNASQDLIEFIKKEITNELSEDIVIKLHTLKPKTGISESIRYCYEWLTQNGKNIVFQIQDDYLFSIDSIHDSIEHFFVVLEESKTHPIIQPFNDITYWAFSYKNSSTPRMISLGKKGYWIQIYDTSCSFLTSHEQFVKHWDLYDKFFELIPNASEKNNILENRSLNYMFTKREVLGLTPINTLTHHIQTQPDLYVDWKEIWESTKI
jgi:predicted ribosome-associated RNA-binding protein Tma20